MADVSTQKIPAQFGSIFRRYVGVNQKCNRVRIPVTYGEPPHFSYVNVYLTIGETIDLISALEDAIETIKKGG